MEDRNRTLSALEQEVQEALARHPELQPALAGLDSARVLSGAVARRVRDDNEVMARAARKGFATSIQLMVLESVDEAAARVLELVRANLTTKPVRPSGSS